MKAQSVFKSNLDYEATYKKAQSHPKVGGLTITEKGLIWMELKVPKTKVMISPEGNVEFAYASHEDRRRVIETLNEILVPEQDENLTIKLTYELKPIHYPGCTPEKEFGALLMEATDKFAALPFFRRKRIGENIVALSLRQPFLKVRKGKPILNTILKRANYVLERLEPRQ